MSALYIQTLVTFHLLLTCHSYFCLKLVLYFMAAALTPSLYKTVCFVARTSVNSILTKVSSSTYWLILVLNAYNTFSV
jgi:hypothetical protein